MRILNYSIRSLIVILGVLIVSGVILKQIDIQMRIVFGIVFILFGIYRLTIYYMQEKRYNLMEEEDEN